MYLHVPLDGKIKGSHLVKRFDGSLQVTPLKTDHQLRAMYFASQDLFIQDTNVIRERLENGYAVALLAGKKMSIPTKSEIGELLLAHSEEIISAGCRISPKQKLPDIEDIVQRIVPAQIDTSHLFVN